MLHPILRTKQLEGKPAPSLNEILSKNLSQAIERDNQARLKQQARERICNPFICKQQKAVCECKEHQGTFGQELAPCPKHGDTRVCSWTGHVCLACHPEETFPCRTCGAVQWKCCC